MTASRFEKAYFRLATVLVIGVLGWEFGLKPWLAARRKLSEQPTVSPGRERADDGDTRQPPEPSRGGISQGGSTAEARPQEAGSSLTRETPSGSAPKNPQDHTTETGPAVVFDADKVAKSETRMWRAYYTRNARMLGIELVQLLSSQFDVSLEEAMTVTEPLMRATMAFDVATGNYGPLVLPDLETAYARLKEVSGLSFLPKAAARAELDWWAARRTPGISSPKEVGRRIARLYAVVFGRTRPEFEKAGLLRAQAADVRDRGGINCDWQEVERLLVESYRELLKGVTPRKD